MVKLYSTLLPTPYRRLRKILKIATHTFLVVERSNGEIHKFAYGSHIRGSLFGNLTLMDYELDVDSMTVNEQKGLKDCFVIPAPKGMADEEFDELVLKKAYSYCEANRLRYSPIIFFSYQGNCNSSTYAVLHQAGVDEDFLSGIRKQMKGLPWGFRYYDTKDKQ